MSKDYFLVVQTVEAGKPVITVVPHKWVSGNTLSWPTKQANELRRNAASIPASSWNKMSCSVKRKYIPTFTEAEQEADNLSGQSTDASDFVPKRKKKLKKDSINKGLDLNHLLTGEQMLRQVTPPAGQQPSKVASTEAPISVVTQSVERIYCQPDLNNLLTNSQGTVLECQSTPAAQTPLTSAMPVDTMVTEGYVVNFQQPDVDSIIREVSDKIDKACEKVVTDVTATVLTSIEAMLAKTAAIMEMKIDATIRSHNFDLHPDDSSSFQFSPVATTDEIDALEENLKDEVYAKQLFVHMKRIIGHTGDACNGLNIAYGLIDHFFDRKLMLVCSWTGESKGETIKYPMKKCVNILDIFFKLVRSVNNTFSRTLLEDFFKRITRNERKRSEAKGKRQSSIHRRAKTRIENKDKSNVHCAPEHSSISTIEAVVGVVSNNPGQTLLLNVNEDLQDSETNSEHEDEGEMSQEDDL